VALREGRPALHGDDRRDELGDRLQIQLSAGTSMRKVFNRSCSPVPPDTKRRE